MDTRPAPDTVFSDALALPPEERAAFVERASGGDRALRDEVLSLLAAYPAARRVFDGAPHLPAVDRPPPAARAPGEVVGAYRLISLIAEGGMGAVYRAARVDEFEKQVAIKFVRPGRGSDRLVERFLRERQVLAGLDHPGIARLLDGGTGPDGQPYLVMELVDGVPIHRYADDHRLDIRSRLGLFLAVCDAIQFAHRNLVVHRDLKPGNILVDADARVRVVDFGIAKALTGSPGADPEAPPTDLPALTPAYASPEQLRGERLTTAADVYSLGVVLCELLAGGRPYETSWLLDAGTIRAICEADPLRPSRIAQRAGDESARRRATTPARLARALAGDLDSVVLRALRKEPERRYATVADLADDVRRFLEDRPLRARSERVPYLVSKFVRRHRWGVAMAALVVAAVAAGGLMTLHANRRLDRQALEARALAYVSSLAAAESAIRDNRAEEARARLDAAPAGLRGWEWGHLLARTDRSQATVAAHDGGITRVAFVADGRSVYTASVDGRVRRWDVAGATLSREWGPLGSGVESIAALGDGFVAGLGDGRVLLVATPDSPPVTLHEGGEWASVAASPGGRRVAAGHRDGRVRVFDPSATRTAEWQAHAAFAIPAWARDGAVILTGGGDGRVRQWDPDTGALLRELESHERRVYAIAVSADGRRAATASMDKTVLVHDLATGAVLTRFHGHDATVSSVCFVTGSERVASCGPDGRLVTWDVAGGKVRSELRGHPADVSAVAASPDGRRLASGDWSGTLKLWRSDAADVQVLAPPSIPTLVPQVHEAATDPGGEWIVCALNQGILPVWRLDESAVPAQTIAGVEQCTRVRFLPDARHVVGATPGGRLLVFDVVARTPVDSLAAHAGAIRDLAVSADGGLWATCAGDDAIRVWNATTRGLLREIEAPDGPVHAVSFTAGGELAWGGADGTIRVTDVTQGTTRVLGTHGGTVVDVECSPLSDRVASVSADGTIRVRDVRSGALLAETTSRRIGAVALAWSADESRLAAGCLDGAVRILGADTLAELVALHGHVARVLSVTFSARGVLVSTSRDGTIRLWDGAHDGA